jgi:outer membrane lipoprotein-sorting protein
VEKCLRLRLIMTAALVLVDLTFSQAPDREALDLIQKIDNLYRSKASFSRIEMEIVTPDWHRKLVLKGWSKGQNRILIRILEPKKESGMGILRINNEMWNYLPKTDKVIKIPPSMMMSPWLGSDFTNNDLVKRFTFLDDFTFRLITPEDVREGYLYLECRPKPGVPIIWNKIVIAVEESGTLPVWEKFYDERDRIVRVLNYSEVKTFGRRTIPSVMEMIPQTKNRYKTVLRYQEIRFDLNLDDSLFSLRNLQSGK